MFVIFGHLIFQCQFEEIVYMITRQSIIELNKEHHFETLIEALCYLAEKLDFDADDKEFLNMIDEEVKEDLFKEAVNNKHIKHFKKYLNNLY